MTSTKRLRLGDTLSARQRQGVWVDLRLDGCDSGRIIRRGRMVTSRPIHLMWLRRSVHGRLRRYAIRLELHDCTSLICFPVGGGP